MHLRCRPVRLSSRTGGWEGLSGVHGHRLSSGAHQGWQDAVSRGSTQPCQPWGGLAKGSGPGSVVDAVEGGQCCSSLLTDCCVSLAEELKEHLLGENAIDRIFTLGNSEFPVSWENEVKLWSFLEDRASLLLKTYKTTIEVIGLMSGYLRFLMFLKRFLLKCKLLNFLAK